MNVWFSLIMYSIFKLVEMISERQRKAPTTLMFYVRGLQKKLLKLNTYKLRSTTYIKVTYQCLSKKLNKREKERKEGKMKN